MESGFLRQGRERSRLACAHRVGRMLSALGAGSGGRLHSQDFFSKLIKGVRFAGCWRPWVPAVPVITNNIDISSILTGDTFRFGFQTGFCRTLLAHDTLELHIKPINISSLGSTRR